MSNWVPKTLTGRLIDADPLTFLIRNMRNLDLTFSDPHHTKRAALSLLLLIPSAQV